MFLEERGLGAWRGHDRRKGRKSMRGQSYGPEVTTLERSWRQEVSQNTSFAEPKLICLTCPLCISKTSSEDSFEQVTEILYEALNRT